MKYFSTRTTVAKLPWRSSNKIFQQRGQFDLDPYLSQHGGIVGLLKADYREAKKILSMYLTDYSSRQLTDCVEGAYSADNFSSPETAPVTELEKGLHVLELWHGPTCAFKDMALQILPYLMTTAVRATGDNKEILILTATSGDTGKAAMEGFSDIPGTRILVFIPGKV